MCANFRRTQRPLFYYSDVLDFRYSDHSIGDEKLYKVVISIKATGVMGP